MALRVPDKGEKFGPVEIDRSGKGSDFRRWTNSTKHRCPDVLWHSYSGVEISGVAETRGL